MPRSRPARRPAAFVLFRRRRRQARACGRCATSPSRAYRRRVEREILVSLDPTAIQAAGSPRSMSPPPARHQCHSSRGPGPIGKNDQAIPHSLPGAKTLNVLAGTMITFRPARSSARRSRNRHPTHGRPADFAHSQRRARGCAPRQQTFEGASDVVVPPPSIAHRDALKEIAQPDAIPQADRYPRWNHQGQTTSRDPRRGSTGAILAVIIVLLFLLRDNQRQPSISRDPCRCPVPICPAFWAMAILGFR